jgi:hypothetical protein
MTSPAVEASLRTALAELDAWCAAHAIRRRADDCLCERDAARAVGLASGATLAAAYREGRLRIEHRVDATGRRWYPARAIAFYMIGGCDRE